MLYIYDARYNLKTPTTYERLSDITGSTYTVLASIKSKNVKYLDLIIVTLLTIKQPNNN